MEHNFSEEFKEHLYRNIYKTSKPEIERALSSFKGSIEVNTLVKVQYPIEKVNEKFYHEGWYCRPFEKLYNDIIEASGMDEETSTRFKDGSLKYIGWDNKPTDNGLNKYEGWIQDSGLPLEDDELRGLTRITEDQYLSIAYNYSSKDIISLSDKIIPNTYSNNTRFIDEDGLIYTIVKVSDDGNNYTISNKDYYTEHFTLQEIDQLLSTVWRKVDTLDERVKNLREKLWAR